MYLKSSFTLILFLVLSCQPVEILAPIEIDTAKLDTISINSKNIEINKKYNSVFSQNNIEEQIQKSPIDVIAEWHHKNILKVGMTLFNRCVQTPKSQQKFSPIISED